MTLECGSCSILCNGAEDKEERGILSSWRSGRMYIKSKSTFSGLIMHDYFSKNNFFRYCVEGRRRGIVCCSKLL